MAAILDWVAPGIALIAAVGFAILPLDRSRVRSGWANALFVITGVVGIFVSGSKLMLLLGWIVPFSGTIHQARVLLCGFALGMICALILSRQLLGSKR